MYSKYDLIDSYLLSEAVLSSEITVGFELEGFYPLDKHHEYTNLMNDYMFYDTNDSSIRVPDNSYRAVEIDLRYGPVSPSWFKTVISRLEKFFEIGFRTNESCGFHAHFKFPMSGSQKDIDIMHFLLVFYLVETGLIGHGLRYRGVDQFENKYASLVATKNYVERAKKYLNRANYDRANALVSFRDIAEEYAGEKYVILNSHSQGTLEWRGLRGVLRDDQEWSMNVIKDFMLNHVYRYAMRLIKAYNDVVSRKYKIVVGDVALDIEDFKIESDRSKALRVLAQKSSTKAPLEPDFVAFRSNLNKVAKYAIEAVKFIKSSKLIDDDLLRTTPSLDTGVEAIRNVAPFASIVTNRARDLNLDVRVLRKTIEVLKYDDDFTRMHEFDNRFNPLFNTLKYGLHIYHAIFSLLSVHRDLPNIFKSFLSSDFERSIEMSSKWLHYSGVETADLVFTAHQVVIYGDEGSVFANRETKSASSINIRSAPRVGSDHPMALWGDPPLLMKIELRTNALAVAANSYFNLDSFTDRVYMNDFQVGKGALLAVSVGSNSAALMNLDGSANQGSMPKKDFKSYVAKALERPGEAVGRMVFVDIKYSDKDSEVVNWKRKGDRFEFEI